MRMDAVVTEEIIARQPPEAQAIIRLLQARIAELEAQVAQSHARTRGVGGEGGATPAGGEGQDAAELLVAA
jgi:hypothetical protein